MKRYSDSFLDTLLNAYREAVDKKRELAEYILLICREIGVLPHEDLQKSLDTARKQGTINTQATTAEDAKGQRNNGNWKTINGTHVLLDKSGMIVGGPKKFIGKTMAEASRPEKREITFIVYCSLSLSFSLSHSHSILSYGIL